MKEAYVGFAGTIYPADAGFFKFVGQMVNYTYRMLGSGENVLHGVKLTLLLTTLSMLIGSLLSIFLALGKISKNKIHFQALQRLHLLFPGYAAADPAVCHLFLGARYLRIFVAFGCLPSGIPRPCTRARFWRR